MRAMGRRLDGGGAKLLAVMRRDGGAKAVEAAMIATRNHVL